MAKAMEHAVDEEVEDEEEAKRWQRAAATKAKKHSRFKELGVSCMLSTEVSALLAAIRRPPDSASHSLPSPDDLADTHVILALKSLRSLIFHPSAEWSSIDPSSYVIPFLDVIQSDEIPVPATAVALSAVLKILRLGIFDEGTPGAAEAVHAVVHGITNCRLERTDPASEDAVLMRILQVLLAVVKCRASVLLTDHAVCTVVNTCFQVVQQSACRGDMLQKNARNTMHELIQVVFSHLSVIKAGDAEPEEEEEEEEEEDGGSLRPAYGASCMADIFHFVVSLLNVVVEVSDGLGPVSWDEDVQLFALILINSAIELGGDAVGDHPKLLAIVQDELFHHLIYYGLRSSPLFLSMICSTVLNLYHFLRRSLRLQLEAFFKLVLLRIAASGGANPNQEVAVEAIINFCRQPMFVMEMYVNYDCDPTCANILEEIGRLLCKIAFPTTNPFSPMQVQAFEGLVTVIGTITENIDVDDRPSREAYQIEILEHKPFWLEKTSDVGDDREAFVEFVRTRKVMKRSVMIAANHFNRDEKKGLEFLKIAHLVADSPPDAKGLACFFRYTPGLEKNSIGDYLGDPDEFNVQVLKEFTETFNFSGVILDTALRTYLETFRLPGESQKIQRILEAFSERFYEQQSSEIFASKDAVFILCYSLIMLNTDQHNPQVKKKMTEEEFIRNNRAINGGKDLPREYLSELFHSISNHAITLFGQSGVVLEMNANRWIELVKRSAVAEPFILCDYEHKLCRDLFVTISGPTVACLSAIFERADDEEMLNESMKGLLSIAKIAQYGLEDILDELLTCFCKFTTLLNPYAAPEETLFAFTNDLKPRLATLAVFTIANKYGDSMRGGWRNMVDCLLKLKRLKLLPQSIFEPDGSTDQAPANLHSHSKSESGVIFPWSQHGGGGGGGRQNLGLMGQFSQFMSLENSSDSMASIGTDFENNQKLIRQCQIGNIFTGSARLPDDSLLNLGRALISAAAGKNQKFSTAVEEEETVGFCWELLVTIVSTNLKRFPTFWPQFHDYFNVVSQFPLFSPCPFAEKAIVALFSICVRLFSTPPHIDKAPEELILKSINTMWKLDKEILDTCCESITESIVKILNENASSIQTMLGWKTLLHLLSISGRHAETYDQSVEALMALMAERTHITRFNYAYFVDAAFGFAALKISPLENSLRILDLLANSVNWLIQWHTNGHSDPGSNVSNASSESASSGSVGSSSSSSAYLPANLFLKLTEALRKTSLVRREEIRNHAVSALRTAFENVEQLDFTPSSCIGGFNLVIFAMVDDLHEKTVEYSRRENSEREARSMEGTLKGAMELMVDVHLRLLMTLQQSSGFKAYWLGVLRRMDTCMKASFGGGGDEEGLMQSLVPELLRRMVLEMKAKGVLAQGGANELWDVTNIQIQWIAPSLNLKDELFPEDF